MTARTKLATVEGGVDIIKVESELMPDQVPTTYVADCTTCGWGLYAPTELEFTLTTAQKHVDDGHPKV